MATATVKRNGRVRRQMRPVQITAQSQPTVTAWLDDSDTPPALVVRGAEVARADWLRPGGECSILADEVMRSALVRHRQVTDVGLLLLGLEWRASIEPPRSVVRATFRWGQSWPVVGLMLAAGRIFYASSTIIGNPFLGRCVNKGNGSTIAPGASRSRKRCKIIATMSTVSIMANSAPIQ